MSIAMLRDLPRSRECEEGAELPPLRILSLVGFVLCFTMAASAGFALALDHWWPYVAGAVACFIIVKSA